MTTGRDLVNASLLGRVPPTTWLQLWSPGPVLLCLVAAVRCIRLSAADWWSCRRAPWHALHRPLALTPGTSRGIRLGSILRHSATRQNAHPI
jgi:hypothetical protein